jgi:hypothetical protein
MNLRAGVSGSTSRRRVCVSGAAMALVLAAMLATQAPALSPSTAVPSQWSNSTTMTVYRVTPIDKEGLANMDSADAAGDVYFGLSQLLLPFACAHGQGNSLWCANRKWLSGGTSWMVYRSFNVDVRLPFGEYARCNPDQQTGEFRCSSSSGGGSGLPPSCGSDYDMHHSRYLNGTVYATLSLPANGSLAGCCAKCSADGKKCGGWQMGAMGKKPKACSFITDGNLLNQPSSGTQIASVAKTGGGGSMPLRPRCWYDEDMNWDGRLLNETFAPYCDRAQCQCDAMDKLSVGLEPHAMCYSRQKKAQAPVAASVAARANAVAGLTARTSPSYWECQGQLAQHCGTFSKNIPRDKCMSCAQSHMAELLKNGCSAEMIAKGCSEPQGCSDAVRQSCGKSAAATSCHHKKNQSACKECELCAYRSPATSAANCSFELVDEGCGDYSHSRHSSIYDEWMSGLACLADGNWYSTQSVSECKPGDASGADCWWRRQDNSPRKGQRMINASCADGRVTGALRKKNPSCWQACGADADNSTSLCSVSCLFTTMLGNETLGTKPLTKEAVVQPFVDAFLPASQGGCPDAVPSSSGGRRSSAENAADDIEN